ncbi:MAG: LysR family transcriptional regulator [Pseudomonadota bacterium]
MIDIRKCMNWDAVAFDWNHIRAFLATVEHGSLSAAARALRQTQPTLSRQISGLEDTLSLTLFERGTRVMALTDAGAELLTHVRAMADSAAQISRVAAGQSQTIAGNVRITCSDALATHALPRIVIALRKKHPGIQVELVPNNDISDLTRRDADIAIRHSRPEQPDLVAKRLADTEIGLFAAESYLADLGSISSPADLGQADFIGYQTAERLVPQMQAFGIPVTKDNFGVTTNHGPTMYELVREGAGITFLPAPLSQGQLGLKQVLPEVLPTFSLPTWLVTHREIQTSRRIRITFDHLAAELSKESWGQRVTQK